MKDYRCPKTLTESSPRSNALDARNGCDGSSHLMRRRHRHRVVQLAALMVAAWIQLTCLAPVSLSAYQETGGGFGDVPFKLLRPTDHQIFQTGTRAISIIGTKPIGPTGLLRIQDPFGNLIEIHYPAIRTFFNAILDGGGMALPAGEWEVTLCNGYEPLKAIDHIHFEIEAGDPPQAFPTIDIPYDGEVYPGNIPFIDFIGVASPDSTVWLRIYRVSTQEKLSEIEINGTLGFMWGHALMWGHGPGEYLAGVSPTSSDVSDYLSDSTTFTILERGDDDWPYLMPFKFLW